MIMENQNLLGVVPKNIKLTKQIPQIPAWDSLNDQEKKLYARQMEAFTGQIVHVDHQIGRIVATLDRIGELDNTLIFITADNGTSSEGALTEMANETYVLNVLKPTLIGTVSPDHLRALGSLLFAYSLPLPILKTENCAF